MFMFKFEEQMLSSIFDDFFIRNIDIHQYSTRQSKKLHFPYVNLLSQQQILGTGNLPQDSAPVCINIDISPEMAAQSAQQNPAFCVTASDWSPIPCQPT